MKDMYSVVGRLKAEQHFQWMMNIHSDFAVTQEL